jgi:hypothetical protein
MTAACHRRGREIQRLAMSVGTRYIERRLPRDPVEVWNAIGGGFSAPEWRGRSTLVDITTMPRKVIYWAFSFLRSAAANIHYVYYRPAGYAPEWLSRDTDRPRLYRHGAEALAYLAVI